MASAEEELIILREKNSELVVNVQFWKMLAAQRENEKLDLMKELNDIRLKLARLRRNGNMLASKLESALESASKNALTHLVKASGEIARSMELAKTYMRECKETEILLPRWSSIGGTPKVEKVHRVPPMVDGGQSIQPVVSQSRNDIMYQMNTSDPHSGDMSDLEESQRMSDDDYSSSRRLDAMAEDLEPEEEVGTHQSNSSTENPLEGTSSLLGASSTNSRQSALEPDSITEVEDLRTTPVTAARSDDPPESVPRVARRLTQEFSPIVRRRKRSSSPPVVTPRREHFSPRPQHRRNSNKRVLKVIGAKMRLDSFSLSGPSSPPSSSPAPKRRASDLSPDRELLDAPSPNEATVPGVKVSEIMQDPGGSGEPVPVRARSRRVRRPRHDPRPCRERRSDRSSPERDSRMDESEEEETRVKQEKESRDSRNRRQDMRSRVASCESRDCDSGSEACGAGAARPVRSRRVRKKVVYY